MGILGTHPAVFVRVANKEVAGYGTWKRVRKMGDRGTGSSGLPDQVGICARQQRWKFYRKNETYREANYSESGTYGAGG
jgi:hypothetical protein